MNYTKFLEKIVIPTPTPKPFKDVAFEWQWNDAKILEQIVLRSTVENYQSPYRHACFIRPRGYDKTSSVARLCLWAVTQKRDMLVKGLACAVDEEQAKLIVESAVEMILMNKWLQNQVKITHSKPTKIYGKGGSIRVMSSDHSSAWGKRPSLVIFDELTHWETQKAKRFFDAIWTSLPKNPRSCCIIISNAGYIGTWQHKLIESLNQNPEWYIDNKPGRLPSWVNEEDLRTAVMGLDEQEVQRIFFNHWIDNSGISLKHLYIQCVSGMENKHGTPYTRYFAGVDYGYKESLTAITVCHKNDDDNKVYIDTIEAYSQITLEQLERIVLDIHSRFPDTLFYFDSYQTMYVIERLQKMGLRVVPVKPTQELNKRAIGTLIALLIDKKIVFPIATGICNNTTISDEFDSFTVTHDGKVKSKTNKDRIMSVCYAILAMMDSASLAGITYNPFFTSKISGFVYQPKHIIYGIQSYGHRTK